MHFERASKDLIKEGKSRMAVTPCMESSQATESVSDVPSCKQMYTYQHLCPLNADIPVPKFEHPIYARVWPMRNHDDHFIVVDCGGDQYLCYRPFQPTVQVGESRRRN